MSQQAELTRLKNDEPLEDVLDVLGPSCVDHRLTVAHMLMLRPGAEAQLPHRDEDVWMHMPSPRPEIELASITGASRFRSE